MTEKKKDGMHATNYGGVFQLMFAVILARRRTEKPMSSDRYEDIPPRDFFNYIAECQLPNVENGGSCNDVAERVNKVIRFLNSTDDILNFKRAVNQILCIIGSNSCLPFPGDNYRPELLNMEGDDD